MPSDPKLIDEAPLLVLPRLAAAIGLNAALVMQQVHYRTAGSDKLWWRASLPELRAVFPFWSENTVQRAITKLRREGLIDVQQDGVDRTNQYRVQDGAIDRLGLSMKRGGAPPQSGVVSIGLNRERGTAKRGEAPASKFAHLDEGTKTA